MSHGSKQNEISQELSMGTKILKASYYTVFTDHFRPLQTIFVYNLLK